MNPPIPTPFDIIPPPPGPWVPSPNAWLVLVALLVVAGWLIRRMGRIHRPVSQQIVAQLLKDLNRTASQEQVHLERLCRVAKRLLAFYIPEDLTGLSSPEMRHAADCLSKGDDSAHSAAAIIRLLADIEDREYAPRQNTTDGTIRSEVDKLTSLFVAHVRRHKPR